MAKEQKDKLAKIRQRCKAAFEYDQENRREAMNDLKFLNLPGYQWDEVVKRERGDRVCFEFNKLRVTAKRIINDMRANRPAGKVRGTEEGDKETADILEGFIRNIWNVSDGDTVIDAAAEYQVGGGMGAWRVTVDYADDSAFDQDIRIEAIRNPFCLYADPACQDSLKRDARYWILTTRIAKTAFEAKWPKAKAVDFESDVEFDDEDEWEDEDSVRIVEYWYKEPVKKVISLLSTGQTVEGNPELPEGVTIVRQRQVNADQIKMCIASGSAILEEADWAGSQFPFVMVYGEHLVVDGESKWFGVTRFSKDAQRAYNYSRTAAIESVALAPQAKFWATPDQAHGHEKYWAEAHKKLYPFMLYNPDLKSPGPPQRMGGADVPVALINEIQLASEDIKSTTGIFDPSLGKQSNEQSGIAIRTRQQQGEIATFNYMDNLSKGIRRTWEILIDLIPKIYDTERAVRILGIDGSEKYARVNQKGPDGQVINDLSRGKYDVTVTVGPSFSTQRQESAEVYTQLAQANPAIFPIAADLIFKSLDLPYSDQLAERFKALLPPQVQQIESQGKLPPEVAQAMAQVDQAMQMVQQQGMMVQQAAAENEQAKAEVEKAIAQLEVQRSNFEAEVAKSLAQITTKEAQLMMSQAKAGVDEGGKAVAADREALATQVQQALATIQQQAAEFMSQAAGIIAQMQATVQPQVFVANPPKNKVVRVKRMGGELVGTVEEVA